MDANTQEQLERLYRGMTAEQIEAHEDWVRRFKAQKAVEQERFAAQIAKATARRIAEKADLAIKLRSMSDNEVVSRALCDGAPSAEDYFPEDALWALKVAGFVRAGDAVILSPAELRNLLEVSWRDGHSRPEIFYDEWPQNMRSDVDQTVAELDKWKVLGVPKEAFPDYEPA